MERCVISAAKYWFFRKWPISFQLIFLGFFVWHYSSQAGGPFGYSMHARILPVKAKFFQIQNLTLKADLIQVHSEEDPWGTLEGSYPREYWTLLFEEKKVSIQRNGRFRVSFRLKGPISVARFIAIGPTGTIEEESFQIEFPEWTALRLASEKKKATILGWTPSASYTLISYEQSSVPGISEAALTGKLSYSHAFNPRWSVGLSGFATLLALKQSNPDFKMSFLGLNLRAGYSIPQVRAPWSLSLMGGAYYTSATGTGANFGYAVYGAQVFPVIRRMLSGENVITAYGKFSPLGSASGGTGFSNHEIAAGAGWEFPLRQGSSHRILIAVDVSFLMLVDESGKGIRVNTGSLGGGYGF